jgi:hypothetical protein
MEVSTDVQEVHMLHSTIEVSTDVQEVHMLHSIIKVSTDVWARNNHPKYLPFPSCCTKIMKIPWSKGVCHVMLLWSVLENSKSELFWIWKIGYNLQGRF